MGHLAEDARIAEYATGRFTPTTDLPASGPPPIGIDRIVTSGLPPLARLQLVAILLKGPPSRDPRLRISSLGTTLADSGQSCIGRAGGSRVAGEECRMDGEIVSPTVPDAGALFWRYQTHGS